MRQRKDYSNTKVKTRNLLTNVFYRRFKQRDFNKKKLILNIMSFLTQNFNPINSDRKLDQEKERDMVKFLRERTSIPKCNFNKVALQPY